MSQQQQTSHLQNTGRYSLHRGDDGQFTVRYLDAVYSYSFCDAVEAFLAEIDSTLQEKIHSKHPKEEVTSLSGCVASDLQQVVIILWETVPKYLPVPGYLLALDGLSICMDFLVTGSYSQYQNNMAELVGAEKFKRESMKYQDPCGALGIFAEIASRYIDLYPTQVKDIRQLYEADPIVAESNVIGFNTVEEPETTPDLRPVGF